MVRRGLTHAVSICVFAAFFYILERNGYIHSDLIYWSAELFYSLNGIAEVGILLENDQIIFILQSVALKVFSFKNSIY
jgi:hypothetical protein